MMITTDNLVAVQRTRVFMPNGKLWRCSYPLAADMVSGVSGGTRNKSSPVTRFGLGIALAAIGLLTACNATSKEKMITLTSSGVAVTVRLSAALAAATEGDTQSSLIFYVMYPSGDTASNSFQPNLTKIKILLRPVGAKMRTRTEGDVDEATTVAPSAPSGRAWLFSKAADGVSIYKVQFKNGIQQEIRVFTAADGSLVGTNMATPESVMHESDRRYKTFLEVIYQYPKTLAIGPEAIDKFVTDYLDANVKLQEKS
jgi:hypothetical protein